MRAFKILFLVLVLFFTFGCSSDDNSASSPEQLILGDWVVANMSIDGNMTGNGNDYDWSWVFEYYPIPIDATIENQNYTVNFSKSNQITSNGSLKASYVAYVDDSFNAYEHSKELSNIDFFENGNWSIDWSANNHFLTVSINNVIEKFPIIELWANKFMIIGHLKDDVLLNLYDDSFEVNCIANLDVLITFQRNL